MKLKYQNKLTLGLLIAIFCLVGFYILPGPYFFSRAINIYDEGVWMVGAQRLANGQSLYSDFWTIYQPLKFIPLSFIYKIFPQTIDTARLLMTFTSVAGLISIYTLFKKNVKPHIAALFCLPLLLFLSPIKPVHLLIFANLLLFHQYIYKPNTKNLPIIIGLLVAITFFTRTDFGVINGGFFILLNLINNKSTIKNGLHDLAKFSLGFGIITIPLISWLILNNNFIPYIKQTFYYPYTGNYLLYRVLEITNSLSNTNNKLIDISNFYRLLFPLISSTLCLFYAIKVKNNQQKTFILIFIIALLTSTPYFFHRSDLAHLNFINLIAYTLTIYTGLHFFRKHQQTAIITLIILITPLLSTSAFEQFKRLKNPPNLTKYSFYNHPIPTSPIYQDMDKIIEFFQDIPNSEPIYIGTTTHSKFFINNVMLYLNLDQPVATKYHELHTGVVNTQPIQDEIIQELQKVNYIVLWDQKVFENNLGGHDTKIKTIDTYIQQNFQTIKTLNEHTILKRK